MDTNMENKVRATVLDFVNRGFMFTAYDITKTLRNDGDRVRHGEVNQFIQNMFRNNEMGMYTKDLVNVGAPVEPFVYYHPYSDVTNYRSDWIETNPSQDDMRNSDTTDNSGGAATLISPAPAVTAPAAAPAAAPVAAPVAAPPTAQPVSHKTTRSTQRVHIPTLENRLEIPSNMIRQVQNSSGCSFFGVSKAINCSFNPKKYIIVLKAGSGHDYTVNKNGRIRLSSSDVRHLNGSSQIDIALRGTDEIVVSSV